MKNGFIFKNETSEQVEIDLFGEIGDSWFGEDTISMDGVKDKLNNAIGKNILLNISSLGGDVNHALAIHDLIKMHKGKVTAKIIGMTASSGTIISMGADRVEMSENALFLVHNAWTAAMGNANDLRQTADELDVVDDRLANVYKNKTGKRKSQILTLMAEERWIDSKEAKEFGFIDTSFKPDSKIDNLILNKINNSNLPKIEIMAKEEKTFFDKVKDFFKVDKELTEDELIAQIKDENETLNSLKTQVADLSEAKAAFDLEKETLITAHQDAVNDLQNTVTELTEKDEAATKQSEMINALADAIGVKSVDEENIITTIQNAVAKMQTEGIKIEGSDPVIDGTQSENIKEYVNELPADVKRKLSNKKNIKK